MNYSPIANPEVKLCLPSATVTAHIFSGSWQESWRLKREKGRRMINVSSDVVCLWPKEVWEWIKPCPLQWRLRSWLEIILGFWTPDFGRASRRGTEGMGGEDAFEKDLMIELCFHFSTGGCNHHNDSWFCFVWFCFYKFSSLTELSWGDKIWSCC